MFLGLCFAFASPGQAQAQRSGFIIGFGLGPGMIAGDAPTKLGLATDFHIGGVINSLELFYVNKVIFTSDDDVDAIVTGVNGVGGAYP